MKNKNIRYRISFLLLIICGFSFGMLFSSPKVIQDDINLNDPKSSAGEITVITPENKTYTEVDSGYYPATFGFENDVDGAKDTEIEFIDLNLSQGGCYAEIVSSIGGHEKVMKIEDDGVGSNIVGVYPQFSAKTNGTMEAYIFLPDASKAIYTEFEIHFTFNFLIYIILSF